MKNIVEMGFAGARSIDIDVPSPALSVQSPDFAAMVTTVADNIPPAANRFQAPTYDGPKDIEVRHFLLHVPAIFSLVHDRLAPFGPLVYAQRAGQPAVLGMVMPGYNPTGEHLMPGIKVQPLAANLPIKTRGGLVVPNEEAAVMMAGATLAEGKGVGGHSGDIAQDFEHRSAVVGAVSKGGPAILDVRGSHERQHDTRANSSIAHGLSNPNLLGNVFVPDGQNTGGFPGYAPPVVFEPSQMVRGDRISQPVAFLANERAYAAFYDEATRVALGSAYQILFNRKGQGTVLNEISRMSEQLAA